MTDEQREMVDRWRSPDPDKGLWNRVLDTLIAVIDAQEAELQALHKREAEMQGAVRMYREANSDLWIATGDHQKVVARRCDLLLRSITNLAIKLFPPLKEVTK